MGSHAMHKISPKELAWLLFPGTEVILVLTCHDGTIKRRSRIVTESSEERVVMCVEEPGDSVIDFQGNSGMKVYLTKDGFVLRSGSVESRYVIVRSGDVTIQE